MRAKRIADRRDLVWSRIIKSQEGPGAETYSEPFGWGSPTAVVAPDGQRAVALASKCQARVVDLREARAEAWYELCARIGKC
jgi:hypothetical protein